MIQDIAFYVLCYILLWRMVGVHLIFHGAGLITNFPSFYTTWEFFTEHLAAPGGPIEYLSAFLSQLFYYSWLGALVITVQAWMLGLCTAYLLRASGFKRWRVIRYVPALLLLVLYGRYTYFLPTTMALLAALLCACAYMAAAQRKALGSSLVSFALLSLVCYYGAGGAFLLFALVCIIYELLFTGRWWLGLSYGPVAVGLPFVVGAFGFGMIHVYSQSLPISWQLLSYEMRARWVEFVYALYLLVPAVMLAGRARPVLGAKFRRRNGNVVVKARRKPQKKAGDRPGTAPSWSQRSPRFSWAVQTAAVVGIAAAVAFGSIDRQRKNCFAIDYYALHKMWPEVIAAGRRQPNDRFVMHAVNRALYHTGRLGNEMFRWPQQPEYLLLAGALVNLVKGNIGTARVYLGALDQTLFHRAWARECIELLASDPNLTTDRDVQRLRSIALEHDFLSVTPATYQMLRRLLEKNPKNRMAFEYMMASCLVNKQLATFIKHIQRFKELGYRTLPTHFEEAALTYVYGTRKPLYLGGYEPRTELRRQIEGFLAVMNRYRGNPAAALAELAPQYRYTYVFYHVYAQPNRTK
jgi:MFS family permease